MAESHRGSMDSMVLSGRRVTVMGLGRFGGGVGAVRYLVARGCQVTVTDLQPAEALADSVQQIRQYPVTLRLGEHREEDFREVDLVVASPAVPRDNRFLRIARQSGVAVTSEMNLFWERCRGRTACVTGANGKSTTTAALHAVLRETGARCWLGGNIGHSLLPSVEEIAPEDWVVLELSSFQLEDLAALQPRPDVAIVTNFSPNHLDRHVTLGAYRSAKQNLLRWQGPAQLAVLNDDDPDVRTWPARGRTLWFGLKDRGNEGAFRLDERHVLFRDGGRELVVPLSDWWSLPGLHNLQNALAVVAAALAMGGSPRALERGFRGFKSLPHRLEIVAETAGRLFVNDSKATTPEAAALAVGAFDRPVILLAGGYDKGVDLSPMIEASVSRPVKGIAVFGATAPSIESALSGHRASGRIARYRGTDLGSAFTWATRISAPGDVIVLSPGCASHDQFRHYEERGDLFRQLAKAWSGPAAPIDPPAPASSP